MRRILIVSERASIVRRGERIKICKGSREMSVPVRYLDLVIVFGGVSLSSEAISLLLKSGVPLFFLTRYGRLRGVLSNGVFASNYNRRLKQFRVYTEDPVSVARLLVGMKIEAIEKEFGLDLSDLRGELDRVRSSEEIMGLEGVASRRMFERFGACIKDGDLKFGGRSYRPPVDEVNALLSLAYTLTYAIAYPLTLLMGYDPYLSFLHAKRGGHASFCSDVIEPVRPLVTRRLSDPVVRKVFTKRDFRREKGGVYLQRESLPKFLNWFEGIKEEVVEGIKDTLVAVAEVTG